MGKILTGFFIIMLAAVASHAVYAESIGKFTKVEGRVDITRPGSPAEEVNAGTQVFEKDIVRSKSNSKAEILFTDGNILKLAQNTRVEISEYINESGRRSAVLNLFRGKIQNRVKKLLGSVLGNDGNRYEVHTPTSVCGVRGTDFFMYYEKGESGATFKEGFGYGYNKNEPDNMIKIEAGESMIIPNADAHPVVQIASDDDIERLEGETTPAEEEEADKEGTDEEKGIESEASGDDQAGEATSEESEGEQEGDSGSASESPEETQAEGEGSTAGGETGSVNSTGDTGAVGDTGDTGIIGDGGDTGEFVPEETLMADLGPGGDLPEVPSPQPETLTPEASPPITPVEPVDPPYIPPVEPSQVEPPPVEPPPVEPPVVPPVEPPPVEPPAPTSLMAFNGNMLGLVSGTHYEGEYVLPYSTDPRKNGNNKSDAQARYEYEYFNFLKDDDVTYLRGMSETEIMDSDSETFYNYAPGGMLYIETGGEDEFAPDVTESSWSGSLAFLADPPSAGYYQRFQDSFTTTIIADTGSFTGDISGMAEDFWGATETEPLAITLSGQYTSSDPLYLFRATLSGTFKSGGAYSGYFGGTAADASGLIHALYLSPDGTGIGILSGEFSGSSDLTGAWSATGTMYATPVSTGRTFTVNEFNSFIGHGFIEVEMLSGTFSGSSETGIKAHGFGDTSYIRGEDWGILNMSFGYAGYDEGLASDSWSGAISGSGLFGEYLDDSGQWRNDGGMWAAKITDGAWLTDGISGEIMGEFLTMTSTGTIDGELIGPGGSGGNWSGISVGLYKKSADLEFSSSFGSGLYLLRGETGGNYSMISNPSMYHYHYDLSSHEGGYTFYNAGAGTDTYYQVNARSFDGTYANFFSQKWVYDHSTGNFISYESTGPFTMFDLTSLATPPGTYTWEYNSSWQGFNMYNTGWLDGIMGGLNDLWGATYANKAGITFLGNYDAQFSVNPSQPFIFANRLDSYNPYNDTDTTPDGGAYAGFISGVLGSSTFGNIYAVYISPVNRAGILIGDYTGSANRVSGIWDATGGIYPVQVEMASSTPGTLLEGLKDKTLYFWGRYDYGSYLYPGEGNFLDSMGYSTGYLYAGGGNHTIRNINGEPWGVWQAVLGGTYSGTPESRWIINYHSDFYIEGVGNTAGMIAKYNVDGTWSDNRIEGDMVGAWVDLNDIVPIVGVSSGKIAGTYDPSDSENLKWQSAAAGVWVKAGEYVGMAATETGRAILSSLNIPAVEIGRTTLSGTGVNVTDITMHDVTFFASSTGSAPEIWATGNITGEFTDNPFGENVMLTNGDLSVDFNIKNWDTMNNTWGADVYNGHGTLSRADTGTTAQIEFSGVAGGTHTGGTSGSFSGEGAGYVSVKP
ncbi:MAG: FecR domain-containing protein [Deltaproteobacteria bacterium]|nr:FecR domain-containing protein [Deltaproteobacteria bacterium]